MEGIYVMQERERLEAELAEARKQLEEALAREGLRHADALALDMRLRVVNHERDEALAAKERAEGERDSLSQYVERHKDREERLESEVERLEALGRQRGLERDEALALADARGRALESLNHDDRCMRPRGIGGQQVRCVCQMQRVEEVLLLAPPQALAQQREYVGALEKVAEIARNTHFYQSPALLSRQLGAMKDALEALDAAKKGER